MVYLLADRSDNAMAVRSAVSLDRYSVMLTVYSLAGNLADNLVDPKEL